jgi:hypothetical protein
MTVPWLPALSVPEEPDELEGLNCAFTATVALTRAPMVRLPLPPVPLPEDPEELLPLFPVFEATILPPETASPPTRYCCMLQPDLPSAQLMLSQL